MATQVALKAMSGVVKHSSEEVELVAVLYDLQVGVSGLLTMIKLGSHLRMFSPWHPMFAW